MNGIVRKYEGEDLIVPSELIKKLGVKPGERILIRPVQFIHSLALSPVEKARRLRVLDALWGSWTDEDESDFKRTRQEMWNRWQTRNSR